MLIRRRVRPPGDGDGRRSRRSLRRAWRHPAVLIGATVALVAVGVVTGYQRAHGGGDVPAAAAASHDPRLDRPLLEAITHVDPAVLRAVGDGGVGVRLAPLAGVPPLTGAGGRPQVLYVAAEACADCAAQRWGMVIALSRFGSFQHLYLTVAPGGAGTAGFTFRGVGYSSTLIDLTTVELTDSNGLPLQTPTPEQADLMARYAAPPYVAAARLPWLDIANRYVTADPGTSPSVIAGLSWAQIAQRLETAGDPVARAILGNANVLTAALCRVTGMQPAAVCSAAPIPDLSARLP